MSAIIAERTVRKSCEQFLIDWVILMGKSKIHETVRLDTILRRPSGSWNVVLRIGMGGLGQLVLMLWQMKLARNAGMSDVRGIVIHEHSPNDTGREAVVPVSQFGR
jgi:hypothetical protein